MIDTAILTLRGDAFYVWGTLAAALALMGVELALLAAGGRDLAARWTPR